MRVLLVVVLFLLPPLWGDEAEERTKIQRVLEALDQQIRLPKSSSMDVPGNLDPVDLEELRAVIRKMEERASEPWSEVTRPILTVKAVRFIPRDLALADIVYRQYGLTLPFDMPSALVLLKHNGNTWRVVAIRSLLDCVPTQPH